MISKFNPFQNFMCSKVLPVVYDESLSYLEIQAKLINYVNEMIESVNNTITAHNELSSHYVDTLKQLDDLKKDIEDMKKGFFIEDESISLSKLDKKFLPLIQEYVVEQIGKLMSFVWFGLNDNGYFIAVIPESWSQIVFSTDVDGNLVLSY